MFFMGAARGYRWLLRRRRRPSRRSIGAASRHDWDVTAPSTSTDDGAVVPVPRDAVSTEVEPSDEPTPAPPAGEPESWWQRLDKKLLLASLFIAIGLVLIGFAVSRAVTGNEAAHLPAAIEEITPAFDAIQVPQQSTVIADLAAGYEGRLVIDGVALPTIRADEVGSQDVQPGEQVKIPPGVRYEPGNATLSFTPGDNQAIKNFDAGSHTVVVIYWKTIEGERTARSYTWSFTTV
jgi:hypothetical protein